MQIGRFQFKPSILVTLISLVVFLVLMSLGLWQLNRAELKIETQQALISNLKQLELDLLTPLDENGKYRFRHARLQGHFDVEHQYLLDNRVEKGRPGFLVITPFVYAVDEAVILVNRGWLPLGKTREDLPSIEVVNTPRIIRGILADLPGKLPSFGINTAVLGGSWPRVIRDVEIEQISLDLGYNVPPYLLHLAQENSAAYTQNWQPVASGPEKNQSYAIQWFSMALVILILFIGLNSRRSEE
ncbi:MAG: SURF1 family protein [Sulfuriflexus sp.]|nr:SURF1 family protein [Sulfuriflexus sp.]